MDLTTEVDREDRGRSVDARVGVVPYSFGHFEPDIRKLISFFHLFNQGCYMSYAIGDDEEKEPRGKHYQEKH